VGNEVLGGQDAGLAEALVGAVLNNAQCYPSSTRSGCSGWTYATIELSTPDSEAVFANSYTPSLRLRVP
jgi:hypothetical protein